MDETTGATAVAESPSSTPASPSSSNTPADRPTSFAEALARVGTTATPNPGVSSSAANAPSPATTVQAQQTDTSASETAAPSQAPQGPIPFERHTAALNNARLKTEQEITQRFQQQYGAHVTLGERIQADPIGTVIGMMSELSNHPEHGQAMVSALARALSARRGQQQARAELDPADAEPQADFQTADGAQFYSAAQLAHLREMDRRRILAEVDQRLQPLQARENQTVAQERLSHATTAARARMSQEVAPLLQQPEFVQHKAAIIERQQAYFRNGDAGLSPQMALSLAYTDVLRDVVMPARAAQQKDQLVADAVRKATGSTSTLGAAPANPAGRPTDFETAFRRISG